MYDKGYVAAVDDYGLYYREGQEKWQLKKDKRELRDSRAASASYRKEISAITTAW
jgi:hypothetical protein